MSPNCTLSQKKLGSFVVLAFIHRGPVNSCNSDGLRFGANTRVRTLPVELWKSKLAYLSSYLTYYKLISWTGTLLKRGTFWSILFFSNRRLSPHRHNSCQLPLACRKRQLEHRRAFLYVLLCMWTQKNGRKTKLQDTVDKEKASGWRSINGLSKFTTNSSTSTT